MPTMLAPSGLRRLNSQLESHYGLPAMIPIAVALFILAPVVGAPFGVIDDHLIIALVGPSGQLTLDRLPSEFAGYVGEFARFRPMYWIFYLVEAALWGSNPTGWYLDRLLLACLSVTGMYALARQFVPWPFAALAGVFVVAGLQAESWYRLFPQEAFAIPLTLWGLVLVGRRRPIGLLLVVLAALTKETFVPFGIVAVAWSWHLGTRRPALTCLSLLLGIGLVIVVRHAMAPDLYAQSRDLRSLLQSGRWLLAATALSTGWPLALILAGIYGRPAIALGLVVLVTATFGPQIYLIAGEQQGRYLLPAILVAALISATGTALAARRAPLIGWSMTVLLLILAARAGVGARDGAFAWTSRNVEFNASVQELHTALAAHPGASLVVRARGPQDTEAVLSIRRFVPEGIAFLELPARVPIDDPLSQRLWDGLQTWSHSGGAGYEPSAPHPNCVSADLGDMLSSPQCATRVSVRGLGY